MPARVCHGLVYVEQGGSAISGREGDAGSVQQAEVNADGTAEAAAAEGGGGGGGLTGQFGWHMWSQAMVSENAGNTGAPHTLCNAMNALHSLSLSLSDTAPRCCCYCR